MNLALWEKTCDEDSWAVLLHLRRLAGPPDVFHDAIFYPLGIIYRISPGKRQMHCARPAIHGRIFPAILLYFYCL
jgi:hypothetical protein